MTKRPIKFPDWFVRGGTILARKRQGDAKAAGEWEAFLEAYGHEMHEMLRAAWLGLTYMHMPEWWFCPLYKGDHQGPPDIVSAPTVDEAFVVARQKWPTASGWRCLGAVDPKDREKATARDNGLTDRVRRDA